MSNVVQIGSSALTPADILDTLRPDAGRMRAIAVVVLMEDGSWHVRHSTTQSSIIDSAAMQLQKFAMSQ